MMVLHFLILLISFQAIKSQPQSIPEYISIETDSEKSQPIVFEYLNYSFKKIIELNKEEDNMIIYKDMIDILGKFYSTFKLPNSWHTTCLYIGQDYSKLDSRIYKNFIEGINIDILGSTLIYIPEKLILSPVFFDNFDLIDNKYPHVTLMVGEYQAVDSNYVLESVFSNNQKLKLLYDSGKIKDRNFKFFMKLEDVPIYFEKDGSYRISKQVYIIKHDNALFLEGVTKKNYYKK